ncbi:MAG TPA: methyltransferase domain-containing protein [Amycolatopsis sp.]|jgi:SAM-dependent methyltransferase|nr:methyltransferase domain-containing protein [Amycolatopsis sp.]
MTEAADLRTTRTAYDTVATDYAEILRTELDEKPLDRAMLGSFAELVRGAGGGPVADLGCGPGRVTAHLRSLGVDAFGIDLSPAMIEVARGRYPGLRFDEGSMTALDLADHALTGIVAWYSIIHTPPESLPTIFAEFGRVLTPGGYLLLAFQVGDERVHLRQGYGHEISLDAYRLAPDRIADLFARFGFVEHARLVREPERWEKTPQAYLMARKPRPE